MDKLEEHEKSKKFSDKMIKRHPNLFKDVNDPKKSLICFGFEHDNGWNHLIEGLLESIAWRIKNKNLPDFNIVQIKQKYSRLRFYVHGADDYIHGMISSVESISGFICEECGKPGVLDEDYGWLKILCPSCKLERDKRYVISAAEFKAKMKTKEKEK